MRSDGGEVTGVSGSSTEKVLLRGTEVEGRGWLGGEHGRAEEDVGGEEVGCGGEEAVLEMSWEIGTGVKPCRLASALAARRERPRSWRITATSASNL